MLPGNPYQWTPHHSERSRYGGGYYSGHDLGPSEYDDDDDYQPYHSLDTVEREQEIEREREVEKPPPKTVSAEVLFGTVDQRNRPTHVSLFMYLYYCLLKSTLTYGCYVHMFQSLCVCTCLRVCICVHVSVYVHTFVLIYCMYIMYNKDSFVYIDVLV